MDGQLITDTGAVAAPGMFEDVLLDSLAVVKHPAALTVRRPGRHPRQRRAAHRGNRPAVRAAARQLATSRRDGGPAIALLLAVSTWSAPGSRETTRPTWTHRAGTGADQASAAAGGWHRRDRPGRGDPGGRGLARGQRGRRNAARDGVAAGGRCPGARRPARHGQRHAGSSGMNHRLTLTAAAAVVLASISLYPLIQGIGWFWAGFGAVIVAATAGTATRLPACPPGWLPRCWRWSRPPAAD